MNFFSTNFCHRFIYFESKIFFSFFFVIKVFFLNVETSGFEILFVFYDYWSSYQMLVVVFYNLMLIG